MSYKYSVNRRKHQRAVNKVFREVNKIIYDDELWLGRFAVVQDCSYMYLEKEDSGSDYKEWGVLIVVYHFIDKKTGRKSTKFRNNSNFITNSNKIMYHMNRFIVEDCLSDILSSGEKISIENAEDFRKVGIQ